MANGNVTITWLGHGSFLFETPSGKRFLLDPWIEGNPTFPEALKNDVTERIDALVITHGHFDHVGDVVSIAQKTQAPILCMFDLVPWFKQQGVAEEQCMGFNMGGTVEAAGVQFTMTPAFHSSSIVDGSGNIVYMGNPAGYVMTFEDGTVVYHAGDTCVFGDMRIIGELYAPDVAILPIGGWFTMDPKQAAYAAKLLGVKRVIPEHYGTFPILSGTPAELQQALSSQNVEVITLEPGQSTTVGKQANATTVGRPGA